MEQHVNKEAVLAAFDAFGDIDTVIKEFRGRQVSEDVIRKICSAPKKVVVAAPAPVKKAPEVVKKAEVKKGA